MKVRNMKMEEQRMKGGLKETRKREEIWGG